ncbi:serine/threonine protein kinase [Cryptococcus deuterogattii 2001/935-1]|nr:serine/threonine protein kinase [Cryptococcus deuterogattii 2001/935-1]
MSLFRDLPPRHLGILPPAPDAAPTPRPSSSSRNDLFTTSWQPELPPPRPLAHDLPPTSNGHANTMPSMKRREAAGPPPRADTSSPARSGQNSPPLVDEFGVPARGHRPASATVPALLPPPHAQHNRDGSPRTSSFFDVVLATDLPAPPPAPALHPVHPGGGNSHPPSNTLSRSTSLRRAPPPPPLFSLARTGSHTNIASGTDRQRSWDSYTSSIPSSPSASASYATAEEDPLSPLHQSPQLPPSRTGQQADWIPPLPPAADDIKLRLVPSSTYFLGEGRYAKVYLAAYKRKQKSKLKGKRGGESLLGRAGLAHHIVGGGAEEKKQVNEDGDGLVGGDWRLCAVKRLAPDRESQTMGLREAFFLNRLMATTASPSSGQGDRPVAFPKSSGRARAVSPLRDSFGQTPESTPSRKSRTTNGSVYITKLIAVKEDGEGSSQSLSHPAHARSASDAIKSQKTKTSNGTPTRQRSSTMLPPHSPTTTAPVDRVAAQVSVGCAKPDIIANMSSFPSFPSLAQAIRQEYAAPSLSRLVLVLEHAPLGTLDRLLRTSPQLVGKKLWGRWAREGTEALEWVHGKGVVHADIKPGNLLLTTDLHIRLSDFGSSLLIHPSHPPTDGLGLGTLPFSPPELVDPSVTFSFPVDIFALGATLYQCITGREPFRGLRSIEMMHHVKKGGLWAYEEEERLSRVGEPYREGVVQAGTPYPSAWRDNYSASSASHILAAGAAGVRRGGSLRVPPTYSTLVEAHEKVGLPPPPPGRPRLKRMTSEESVRANDDAGKSESPAGVKLWAKWVKDGAGVDPVTALLSESDANFPTTDLASSKVNLSRGNSQSLRRSASIRNGLPDTISASRYSPPNTDAEPVSPGTPPSNHHHPPLTLTIHSPASSAPSHPSPPPSPRPPSIIQRGIYESYADGSPAMLFLDGTERVSEDVRDVLKGMLEPDQWMRYRANEVRERWDELGVGIEEEVESEEDGHCLVQWQGADERE